jgi:excisionase family DNA binding protein
MTTAELEPTFSPEQVAVHFGVDAKTIRLWLADGKLGGFHAGRRRWRIRQRDIEAFVRQGGAKE